MYSRYQIIPNSFKSGSASLFYYYIYLQIMKSLIKQNSKIWPNKRTVHNIHRMLTQRTKLGEGAKAWILRKQMSYLGVWFTKTKQKQKDGLIVYI